MSGDAPGAVRVAVDAEVCMGSGTCMAIAPELFDMGDDGTAYPLSPVVERSVKVDEAMSRCPTGAIEAVPQSQAT